MYSVIDIETTGGNAFTGKITEIAIFVFDGKKVVDQFETLINPEKKIPPFVSRLTGISNAMVSNAPKFYEVAKRVVEMTEGTTFVAHNSAFDYGFIKSEFKRLGYNYSRPTICTVKLSRNLLPGMPSYSLGKLSKHLGIEIKDRHRASGDAAATVEILKLLLEKKNNLTGTEPSDHKGTDHVEASSPFLNTDLIEGIPNTTGVYYFYNKERELIYVGKSKKMRHRILSHLNNYTSKKGIKMLQQIHHIDCDYTGSELVALLKEAEEIKRNKPLYNRATRNTFFQYQLNTYYNDEGYLCFKIVRENKSENAVNSFTHIKEAKSALYKLTAKYELCQKLNGLYKTSSACFQQQVGQCKGACIGQEPSESYNERAEQAIKHSEIQGKTLVIVDKGRTENERAYILVKKGVYHGFAFLEEDMPITSVHDIKDLVHNGVNDKHTVRIINSFIRRKKVKVIELHG